MGPRKQIYLEPERGVILRLTSQNLSAIENASEADSICAFENGAIGAFAHLSDSDDNFRHNGHLYHAAWAAALCFHSDQVPLQTPISKPAISGTFDCGMDVALNCANAAAISRIHGLDSKLEMYARLQAETDDELAAQCELVRDLFDFPI